jgi:hypothetical protein
MFLGLQDPDPLSEVRIRIRILPFSHKDVERTEIMLAKCRILTHIFSKKLNFKTEDNVPAGKLKEKICEK